MKIFFKHIISIGLAALLLVLSFNIPLNKHFCGGELASSSFLFKKGCGMEMQSESFNKKGCSLSKKDCCSSTTELLKLDIEKQFHSFVKNLFSNYIVISYNFKTLSFFCFKYFVSPFSDKPPNLYLNQLFKVFQQFLI